MSAGEALPLLLVAGLLLVSVLAITRRNGNGSGADWRLLLEDIRKERDMWRDLAIERGEQLRQLGVAPITISENETLSVLARDLEAKFSMDEMRALAFSIGINPESLQDETASELARELVMSANRRNRLERLVAEMQQERPS